jgi:hypothetical protein
MRWSRESLLKLREVLAELYPLREDILRVLKDAGVKVSLVRFEGSAINIWFSALEVANNNDQVEKVAEVALRDYPDHQGLQKAASGEAPPTLDVPALDASVWRGQLRGEQLEQLLGAQSTLVPISFLEQGLLAARSVARIQRADGSYGSGFLIGRNLMLTNHHVLPSAQVAADAQAHFNYQQDVQGLAAPMKPYALRPDHCFVSSQEEDWTAVAVDEAAERDWGFLPLTRREARKNDRVNIIQHPGGGPKHLALFHNLVAYSDASRIQYLTDTLPGSSGSPVLDAQWHVVAMHRLGGWLVEPGSKQAHFRNEGIPINVILEGLAQRNLVVG